jgi:hypothetical protein
MGITIELFLVPSLELLLFTELQRLIHPIQFLSLFGGFGWIVVFDHAPGFLYHNLNL